jgi:hypothetical protein
VDLNLQPEFAWGRCVELSDVYVYETVWYVVEMDLDLDLVALHLGGREVFAGLVAGRLEREAVATGIKSDLADARWPPDQELAGYLNLLQD